MTNKEAIETLKAICGDCRLFPECAYKKSECFTAIDMAIKALEQPEQKKDGETMLTIERKKHIVRSRQLNRKSSGAGTAHGMDSGASATISIVTDSAMMISVVKE